MSGGEDDDQICNQALAVEACLQLQAEDSEGFRVGLISAAAWLLAEYVRGGASIDRVMSDVRDHVQSRLPEIPLNKLN